MCESMHSSKQYVTPEWVFQLGVPGVPHVALRGHDQTDPVFWDERYLDAHEPFIAALGEYLDGREGFEFIDIGSIGEWGEMHLGLHVPGRWTPEQLEQTGYTDDRYIHAYRRVIDAFAGAFPRSPVFLNVGSYDCINDYAALRGVHFRQDGLLPGGPSANVGQRFYHPYSRRGVKCNYEFHSGYDRYVRDFGGVRSTVEKGLEDPISYLNTNIFSMGRIDEAPEEAKEALLHAGRRIGFRFVPTRVRYLSQFHVDGQRPGRLLVEHTWQNQGVAPCYESYGIRFSLADAAGDTVAEQTVYPRTPTTLWWPGEEVTLTSLFRIPADTPPGEYSLRVGMIDPEREGRPILLGIAGRDGQDRYPLGPVTAVAGASQQAVVYEQGFEDEDALWNATEGMTAAIDQANAHDGQGCLLLTGEQAGAWNYAAHELEQPVLPVSKYRLSCWMLVEELEPANKAPYLKIGLTDAEGEWLTNCHTQRYDTTRRGEWQQLTGVFETTADTASGHLAIEKGGRTTTMRATIRLDDVELELLEAP